MDLAVAMAVVAMRTIMSVSPLEVVVVSLRAMGEASDGAWRILNESLARRMGEKLAMSRALPAVLAGRYQWSVSATRFDGSSRR